MHCCAQSEKFHGFIFEIQEYITYVCANPGVRGSNIPPSSFFYIVDYKALFIIPWTKRMQFYDS